MGPIYKKYRIYVSTAGAGYVVAASNTVNNLVALTKYWLENTSAGMSLADDITGTVTIHHLDPDTGAYKRGAGKSFKDKDDILAKLREMGAR